MSPADAARLLRANFGAAIPVPAAEVSGLPAVLAALGIAGGAVYDIIDGA